ncbi:helix-turn-helix domain-containing protein [Amycolatopsis cihanbeyliensis]|uniref:Helix-turn-helix protein n=1 Tax=Amycolatopsis cihanbeyliensis TaxID=1128664 RepID=A0A542DKW0_AMYCI|nr:helix-turn-helix transcriptional regulator [Amycolatopsis cihanbeyliensis]TQJ03664.1 helix-turn-helix protein [Amycolatopsis cihanbeyliensis]
MTDGPATEAPSPNVRLRRIARVLREWRARTDYKQEDVASRAGWSRAKQSRLEAATPPIRPADVVTLALVYGIDEEEREALFNSAQIAQAPGWWESVKEGALDADVLDYVQLEAEATKLRTFKVDVVPGLLQTLEYGAALDRASVPALPVEAEQDRLDARMHRQGRLTDDTPLQVEAILTEAALHVEVGGAEVMRRQRGRLLELAALPNVRLRVIPASAGAYPATGVPFSILGFEGSPADSDVGYVELLGRGVYLERAEDVRPYSLAFGSLRNVAMSPRETVELISVLSNTTT